jgi:hypothetical protein
MNKYSDESRVSLEYISCQTLPNHSSRPKVFRETEVGEGLDLLTSRQNLIKP